MPSKKKKLNRLRKKGIFPGEVTQLNKKSYSFWSFFKMSVLLLLAGYGMIRMLDWQEKKTVERIKSDNLKAMGTVVDVGSTKYNYYVVAEYNVDGIKYTRKDQFPANTILPGEHYEIFYSKYHPQESRIDFATPVFLLEDVTSYTIGKILKKNRSTVEFIYNVEGHTFHRWQVFEKAIKEGEIYSIEYLVANPRISRLRQKAVAGN